MCIKQMQAKKQCDEHYDRDRYLTVEWAVTHRKMRVKCKASNRDTTVGVIKTISVNTLSYYNSVWVARAKAGSN